MYMHQQSIPSDHELKHLQQLIIYKEKLLSDMRSLQRTQNPVNVLMQEKIMKSIRIQTQQKQKEKQVMVNKLINLKYKLEGEIKEKWRMQEIIMEMKIGQTKNQGQNRNKQGSQPPNKLLKQTELITSLLLKNNIQKQKQSQNLTPKIVEWSQKIAPLLEINQKLKEQLKQVQQSQISKIKQKLQEIKQQKIQVQIKINLKKDEIIKIKEFQYQDKCIKRDIINEQLNQMKNIYQRELEILKQKQKTIDNISFEIEQKQNQLRFQKQSIYKENQRIQRIDQENVENYLALQQFRSYFIQLKQQHADLNKIKQICMPVQESARLNTEVSEEDSTSLQLKGDSRMQYACIRKNNISPKQKANKQNIQIRKVFTDLLPRKNEQENYKKGEQYSTGFSYFVSNENSI